MKKEEMFNIVRDLEFDKNKVVYKKGNLEIYLFRPSKLSKRFEGYDLKKTFKYGLKMVKENLDLIT